MVDWTHADEYTNVKILEREECEPLTHQEFADAYAALVCRAMYSRLCPNCLRTTMEGVEGFLHAAVSKDVLGRKGH